MTTLKRFFVLILLVAAFLVGYWAGHHPGSPDIVATARDAYGQVADAASALGASSQDDGLAARISGGLGACIGPEAHPTR